MPLILCRKTHNRLHISQENSFDALWQSVRSGSLCISLNELAQRMRSSSVTSHAARTGRWRVWCQGDWGRSSVFEMAQKFQLKRNSDFFIIFFVSKICRTCWSWSCRFRQATLRSSTLQRRFVSHSNVAKSLEARNWFWEWSQVERHLARGALLASCALSRED